MRNLTVILFLLANLSCTSEDSVNTITIGEKSYIPSFALSSLTVTEGESTDVIINFNIPVESNGFLEIDLSASSAVLNSDFTTDPTPDEGNIITLPVIAGDSSLAFRVNTLIDDDSDIEFIKLKTSDGSDFIKLSDNELTITIADAPDPTDPTDPVDPSQTLTVVTWNIEYFPKAGTTTINKVAEIIESMDADVIALQEIADESAFDQLDNLLTEYEGKFYDVRYGQELAFLFKSSEITSISALTDIYSTDRDAFPREPVLVTITHSNGLEVTLINIHLKCCGGTGSDEANRREAASIKLEDYVDTNKPTNNVIILGDWNDDINDGPFNNFIANDENYQFADMPIALGSSDFYSYPFSSQYLSHLDHILITNELFDNLISVETLRIDQEIGASFYESNISDHRPVSATFSN